MPSEATTRRPIFRQHHVRGAIKATTDAGLTVKRLRFDTVTGALVIDIDTGLPPCTDETIKKDALSKR
jgi:hypothetical protein